MVKHEARTQELLRERSQRQRARQVWIALAVIWGVVLGWVAWGLVNSIDGDTISVFAWLVYLVPLAVLVAGALRAWMRYRETDRELLANAD